MKKIILCCFACALAFMSFGQVITVVDQQTDEPLEFVTIYNQDQLTFTTTNSKGQADIAVFTVGDTLNFRMVGYKAESIPMGLLPQDAFRVKLKPSQITMDEVVVSASRWKQTGAEVPSKITNISAKEVALQNPQTAADLLSVSGDVFIQKSQQGGGSPMIRGFATNRLLYAVDGVRMNTAIFRSGNLQNVISLDPFAMENTEVLFGPGSVMYGSDAIGGVMSFQTLKPQLSLNDQAMVSGKAVARIATANNENTIHFDVNVGWKKWAMVTSVSNQNYGDLKMGSNGPEEYLRPVFVRRQDSIDVVVDNPDPKVQTPSGYSQTNLMQKIHFKPNTNWDFDYGFHYSETSDYARYDRHLRTKNGLPRYGEWKYGPQKWVMNNLNITNHKSNKLYDDVSLSLAVQNFEESRISRDFNKVSREVRTEKVDALSANLDFHKRDGKSTWYYGAEWVLNNVTSEGVDFDISTGVKSEGASRYPQSKWSSLGVYLTHQYALTNKVTLQTGARYNQYSISADFDTTFYPFPYTTAELNRGALTGSLGMVYRLTNKFTVSTNLATGFRSPNIDDMGKVFDSQPGFVVVPNPNLEAEYAYNADLGIAKVFGESVKIDITGYYTLLQNALVNRNFVLNGMDSITYDGTLSQVTAIQNAAKATVYGIQAGIEIKLPAGFGLSSKINFQKGEEELENGDKSPSRHAAPVFGVTRLTYSVQKLNMQLYATYSGAASNEDLPFGEQSKDYIYAVDNNGLPYSPSWYTLNFKALYKVDKHFTLSAGIENITDQRYRPYSSGLVSAGRNFILSLRAQF